MNKIIFLAPNRIEHSRFNRFFSKKGDIHICYHSVLDIFRLHTLAKKNVLFVLNGLRMPDIFIIKFLSSYDANIFILQHNSKIPQYTIIQLLKKFFGDSKKYLLWIFICFYFASFFFIRRMISAKRFHPNINGFVYGEDYMRKIYNLMPSAKVDLLPEPNMFKYGSTEDIKIVNKYIEVLFIDEPFESTLGYSSLRVIEHIRKIINSEDIYIKLHPRSDLHKYEHPSLDYVKIIDYIPANIGLVFGFKSNLFYYIKDFKVKYQFNVELEEFEIISDLSDKTNIDDGYIDRVIKELERVRNIK